MMRGVDVVAALRIHNFRLYFAGQTVSLTGTWMQVVAQSWLVLQLTGSGTVLGLLAATQFLPVLVLGAYGGLLVDRWNTRTLLLVTQAALGSLALVLGILTVTHTVRLWMVLALALMLGTVSAVDAPARQAFLPELVVSDVLPNAVSLNSVMTNASRAVGPAIAGLIIGWYGVGACFLINAGTFAAVLAALAAMHTDELHPPAAVTHKSGQVRQGLRYVRDTPILLVPLMMMALVGTLAFEFAVVLPLLARFSLHGGAALYGLMTAVMGAGAVVGGLVVAAYNRAGLLPCTAAALGFGAAMLAAALVTPAFGVLAALALAGAFGTAFLSTDNATLQLASDPSHRGRVMALWSVTFLGSTPIGGPIIGAIAEHASPRYALAAGAAACLAAAGIGAFSLARVPAQVRHGTRTSDARSASSTSDGSDGRWLR